MSLCLQYIWFPGFAMVMVGFCQLAQYCVIGTVIDVKVSKKGRYSSKESFSCTFLTQKLE